MVDLAPTRMARSRLTHQWTAVLLVVVAAVQRCRPAAACKGTPPQLKELFVGRCLNWIVEHGDENHNHDDCETLWTLFADVSQSKDPLTVTPDDWNAYLNKTDFSAPPNATLFWSGTGALDTNDVVHRYQTASGRELVTLEGTLGGSLLNQLTWCGSVTSPDGWNSTCCPWEGVQKSFWTVASARYAEATQGSWAGLFRAYVNNDGVVRKIWGNDPPSFFEAQELNNIPADNQGDINILIVQNPDVPGERCGSGSVPRLMAAIAERFPSSVIRCTDDPDAVVFLICGADPDSAQCRYLQRELLPTSHRVDLDVGAVVGIALGSFFAGLLAMHACYSFKHSSRKSKPYGTF